MTNMICIHKSSRRPFLLIDCAQFLLGGEKKNMNACGVCFVLGVQADRLAGQISSGSEGQHWEIWSRCPRLPPPPPTCLGAGAGALVSALAARTGSLGRRDIRGQCPVQCLSLTWHQEVRRHVYTSRVHLYFEVCFCYEFSQYSEFGGKWGMF